MLESNLIINWHLKFGGTSDSKRSSRFFFKAVTGHLKQLTKNAYAASRSQIKVRGRFIE